MGFRGGVISESPPHPGSGEQGSRPHVEGRPCARRVGASPGGGEADLGPVRDSRGGSVCQPAQQPLCPVVLHGPERRPALGGDASAHKPWPRKLLYAFPPLRLILPLLGRVRRERLSIILVAPDRVRAPWYSEMTQMKVGQPWALPQFWGAMSQEAGAIGALPTLGRPLQAWLLRGTG
ncbi:hypothetical protein OYC64_005605 [Pagothenia borchgrevinki]|uniref:Uncharacterized protein n=1 Tax=Pagothenia borchgrevinki TaxID=8213 RepID=A0ABD2GHH1_PAGBO